MTVNTPLPYYEPFNYPNGTPWPQGDANTSGWLIPGPDGMTGDPSHATVQGGSGQIIVTPDWVGGVPQFAARLPLDNAPTFDLSFTIDISDLVPTYGGYPDIRGGYYFTWLHFQLEDTAGGTVFYELAYDADLDVDQGLTTPKLRATIYQAATWNPLAVVPLNLDTTASLSVRIQESGTNRSLRVWQGIEPTSWTASYGSASVHTGPRYIDLSVVSQQNGGNRSFSLSEIGVNDTATAPLQWQAVGSTTHFNFWYDSSLGPQGAIDANQEMVYIEDDLLNHFRWFGNTAPWVNGPAKVDVKYYNDNHSPSPIASGVLAWYEPSEHTIYINWAEPRQNPELSTLSMERAIIVHELVHHFQDMTFLGGYMREQSFQEAHAAFLERQFRAVIDPFELREGGYASYVGEFINSTRPNYVTQSYTGSGPQLELAIGCQLLFLNWLRYQKGYSAAAITQSQSPVKWGTPQSVYAALTGDFLIDPSVKFFAELEQAFPVGTTVDTSNWPDIANPYPLGVPSANGSGGAALGGAIFGTAKGGLKGFPHPR